MDSSLTVCLFLQEMAKNVRKLLEKTPKDEAVSARDKISGSRFPSSVSAQDLRLLDMKKGKDEHTPKGILEFCAESFVPEMQTSCLGSSESKSSWKNFSLVELQNATKNFHHENLIGKGGYAEVYKGRLKDGQFIAIKRLTQGTPEERVMSFLHELGIIAHVNHPNTAKLIGYGVQGGLHLVLQLSPLGSLGSLLHVTKSKLEWSSRYKIALGTADGLRYLHEHCQRRIIHRDIKADNILLTEDFEPQVPLKPKHN
ncbi:Receptor-like cytosolic serine/threonine-protein kinase RBK2 [Vitis vinifera]|uniref:Receptor-like cytosolic serine/threonine-protein kinase RBK2 n=1 Tax=Vitis vinifera TaxID=29760 RepID=A0A438F041_VITVI|nr:Receptor-like cytosolic serine/threonine-protein kinase RBK2 [Vitis vinifera]